MDALGNFGMCFMLKFNLVISLEVMICWPLKPVVYNLPPLFHTNIGSLEYEEWSSHIQAWKLESAAIIEPPCNFIISSHAKGKRR